MDFLEEHVFRDIFDRRLDKVATVNGFGLDLNLKRVNCLVLVLPSVLFGHDLPQNINVEFVTFLSNLHVAGLLQL